MNIAELLQERVRRSPKAPAIIEARNQISFAELEIEVARAAAMMRDRGLQAGDAVLVFQAISIELYIALLAVLRLGLVAVFIDPQAGRQHIDRCCRLYPPQALIASTKAQLLRFVSSAIRRIPRKFVIGFGVPGARKWSLRSRYTPLETIHDSQADDPALVTFTSGSTGLPKAAVRTHGFLLAQHRVLERSLALQSGEIDLITLPIFVLANLASGVTSLIPNADLRFPGSIDAATVMEQIDAIQPTRSAASPAFFECLVDYCQQHHRTMPSFNQLYTGGAPVFPHLLDRLQHLAPRADVVAVYGSTEAEPIAHVARHEIHDNEIDAMITGKGLLAGEPVSEIQLRILPDRWGEQIGPFRQKDFDAACLPAGQLGEIVINGEHVLPGYLHGRGDEETKFKVEEQRWHRTGDAGYLDQKGRLWLLGRCLARIEDEYGTLYPFAVECAAYQQPGVHRAALVALKGERILIIESAATRAPDLDALARQLAWARLADIRPVKTIPVDKRHNAKIDYPALLQLLNKD